MSITGCKSKIVMDVLQDHKHISFTYDFVPNKDTLDNYDAGLSSTLNNLYNLSPDFDIRYIIVSNIETDCNDAEYLEYASSGVKNTYNANSEAGSNLIVLLNTKISRVDQLAQMLNGIKLPKNFNGIEYAYMP